MARKSNGTYRLCVDFREITRVIKEDAHALPPMTNILDKLQKANYINAIDMDAFWTYQCPCDVLTFDW